MRAWWLHLLWPLGSAATTAAGRLPALRNAGVVAAFTMAAGVSGHYGGGQVARDTEMAGRQASGGSQPSEGRTLPLSDSHKMGELKKRRT